MHAEPSSAVNSFKVCSLRVVSTVLIALAVALTGCKTEQAADNPTIIGVPSPKAWLGVEYAYNFGAYGGEGILDYSLSNAPSWLALEDTSNKARQGIIIRGVPGVTGGERGDLDLGTYEDVTLLTTDGQSVGVQPFKIEVKKNLLKLAASDVQEGIAAQSEPTNSKQCAMPVLDESGEHTFSANVYDDTGEFVRQEQRTRPTTSMLVRVQLDQPSVTRIQVAFELTSPFNPDSCDTGISSPHQKCEYGSKNQRAAIIGQDVVAWTSMAVPDYLTYQKDDNDQYTKGVVTLEPGISECFIRLEIIDDAVAERNETFSVVLTEVRSGLAGFDGAKNSTSVTVDIKDNEPKARLQTVQGAARDVINSNEAHRFTVRMEGARDEEFRVRLTDAPASLAIQGTDYHLRIPAVGLAQGPQPNAKTHYALDDPALDDWAPGDTLIFPADVNEASFLVVMESGYSNSLVNDKVIVLKVDDAYQAGRQGYAGSDGAELRIGINELTSEWVVGQSGGFHITSIALGHDGRTFVAGYDEADGHHPRVDIYDQKGNVITNAITLPAVPVATDSGPVIHYAERSVGDTLKRQLAVSFGTEDALAGTAGYGQIDLATLLYSFDTAQTPPAYIETWRIQTGTSGDDKPRSMGIDEDGNVFITGETSGQWPDQSARGSTDSFIQRVDTKLDGNDEIAVLAWTRQAGSSAADSVVAGVTGTTRATVFGHTTGDVEGQLGSGGIDFYYYSAFNSDGNLNIIQRGTDADDPITDGLLMGSSVWLLGNSTGLYETGTIKDDSNRDMPKLTRTELNSMAGFLLRYSMAGMFSKAVSFNDSDDTGDEHFNVLIKFDDDLIVAGASNGVFADAANNVAQLNQPVIVRVQLAATSQPGAIKPPSEGEEEQKQNEGEVLWKAQPEQNNTTAVQLAQYRDDEISALVEEQTVAGDTLWKILLLSGEGRVLNAP